MFVSIHFAEFDGSAVAVGAFKVAIELDLKRRENDKKIALLFLEMRDMMSALVE